MNFEELFDKLHEAEPPLAILNHNNPDPDSMSSAYALGELSEKDYKIITENSVNRPENQALVHYLGLDIENLNSKEFDGKMEKEFGSVSIVDSQLGNLPDGYDNIIKERYLDKLISIQDHHSLEEETESLDGDNIYIDIRPDVGSTATILTECIDNSDFELNGLMATALYHGLYTDTGSMKKSLKDADVTALSKLNNYIDWGKFGEITGEEYSPETLEVFRRVIENKDVKDQYLVSNTGIISEDNISSVSQSADFISKQEKIDVAIVSGIDEDNEKIQISVRAMGTKNNAEDIVMEGYNKFPGSKVGGRKKAAGGSIPLGFTKYSLGDDGFAEFIFKNIKRAAWDAVGKD